MSKAPGGSTHGAVGAEGEEQRQRRGCDREWGREVVVRDIGRPCAGTPPRTEPFTPQAALPLPRQQPRCRSSRACALRMPAHV